MRYETILDSLWFILLFLFAPKLLPNEEVSEEDPIDQIVGITKSHHFQFFAHVYEQEALGSYDEALEASFIYLKTGEVNPKIRLVARQFLETAE